MAVFRINLIRDSTPPPETRKAVFRAMVIYVAFWGVLLVATVYAGTKTLIAVQGKRQDAVGAEREFRVMHPGADVITYGVDVKQQLQTAVAQLETLNAVRAQRLDLPRVLLALTAPLPTDVNIISWDADREKGSIGFDLMFPVGEGGQAMDVSRLIAAWNADPLLVEQVRKVSSVRSQRQKVGGNVVETWRFACGASGGGS